MPACQALCSAEFTVNAPTNAVAVGREAVLDAFVRRGVMNFSSFELAIEYLRIDGDWAIIMGAETPIGVRTDVQRRFGFRLA